MKEQRYPPLSKRQTDMEGRIIINKANNGSSGPITADIL